jgi:hypothetical protein
MFCYQCRQLRAWFIPVGMVSIICCTFFSDEIFKLLTSIVVQDGYERRIFLYSCSSTMKKKHETISLTFVWEYLRSINSKYWLTKIIRWVLISYSKNVKLYWLPIYTSYEEECYDFLEYVVAVFFMHVKFCMFYINICYENICKP